MSQSTASVLISVAYYNQQSKSQNRFAGYYFKFSFHFLFFVNSVFLDN